MFSSTVIILCFDLETDGVTGGSCQTGFIYGLGQKPGDGVEGGELGDRPNVDPVGGDSELNQFLLFISHAVYGIW